MNLFQINTQVDPQILKNAFYDIGCYLEFIDNSINRLKRETLSVIVKHEKVTVREVNSESIEYRYFPVPPSDKKSEKSTELLFNENTKIVFDQNKQFNHENKIRILEKNEEENYIVLSKEFQGNSLYLKPDTYQLERQRWALNNLINRPLIEHRPLLELFGYPDSHYWAQPFDKESINWYILNDESKSGTDEQRDFVYKALNTKDFALMEGPPGSGKTTTIIELIMQFAAQNKRVLLCSATHAAIDNVIERIKGRYKDICDKEIVPVRISRFEKPVKENVRPFLLQHIVNTYKEEIKKHLSNNQTLESQVFLLKNLYRESEVNIEKTKSAILQHIINSSKKDKVVSCTNRGGLIDILSQLIDAQDQNSSDINNAELKQILTDLKNEEDPVEKIILDSANLVAGTMIGILQHPDIRANKQGASFDVLIVDEASKVTFADFIVPALHAKKWILVGDIKQLSPYVENDYVSENISNLLAKDIQNIIVNQFELKSKLNDGRYDDCLKVFFTDNNPEDERDCISEDNLMVELIDQAHKFDDNDVLKLNASDVVIAKNTNVIRQKLSSNIKVKSIFINDDMNSTSQKYLQNYFRKDLKRKAPYIFDSRKDDWSEMVASRLNQSFSFRNAGDEFSNIDKELSYLIPERIKIKKENISYNEPKEIALSDEINMIKRLVFPSILELLQKGIGKNVNQKSNRVISDGFYGLYKDSRFVSLTYQHRMHPDIARTSKENFYNNNLEPANTVKMDRNWHYALNEPVVKWIHNNDKTGNMKNNRIINPTEVNDIQKEVIKFLNWAKDNPGVNEDGKIINYELAILTFYLYQETELRKMIRGVTKQKNTFSKFHMNHTDIYLYTVDKFQGQEADFVLLGFTKFSPDAHYNSPNRLNVALTRARHKLILFGNQKWFQEYAKLKALRDLAANYQSVLQYRT